MFHMYSLILFCDIKENFLSDINIVYDRPSIWSIVSVALKHCTNRILLKFFSKWFQIFQNNLKVITLIFTPYSSVFTVNFEHVIPDWMQISWNLRLHIKHGIPKISCCNMFYFFGYAHSKYVKCLFTNIQKKRILKIVYFYKQKNLTIK